MNPDIAFQCANGEIIALQHPVYPWEEEKIETAVLFGGAVITRKDFYTFIYNQVQQVLPYLFNEYPYSLKKLMLPWVWERFNLGNRVMAGTCFKHMIVEKYVPFTPRMLPSDRSGTRHYYYIGPNCSIWDSGPPKPNFKGD